MLSIAILLTAPVVSCGSVGGSPTDGGAAGSPADGGGAGPPPAEAAMVIHISQALNPPKGTTCTIPTHGAQIGQTAPSASNPGTVVKDGDNLVTVKCTVSGTSTFNVNGAMRQDQVTFQALATIPATGGTVAISAFDPTSATTMYSPTDLPCTVTPLEIASGRIWASYHCPGLADPNSPATYCQADGYFVFENCKQ